MAGFHYDDKQQMVRLMASAMKDSLWNRTWSNITHDTRICFIARFLSWQMISRRSPGSSPPFAGNNLYALLLLGRLPFLLLAAPYSPDGELALEGWDPYQSEASSHDFIPQLPSLMAEMQSRTSVLLGGLSEQERMEYKVFATKWVGYYRSEVANATSTHVTNSS